MKITIVFDILDRDSFMGAIMALHVSGTPIFGAIPTTIADGDQVTVPGEITDGMAFLADAYDENAAMHLADVAKAFLEPAN
jgi:hypothetical protein